MARPTLIDVGNFTAPAGQPFDMNAPFLVSAATNLGTVNHLDAFYFAHAALMARNLTESDYDGMRAVHIQITDQHGRVAIDLRRANANTFNVAYHPDLSFRFN